VTVIEEEEKEKTLKSSPTEKEEHSQLRFLTPMGEGVGDVGGLVEQSRTRKGWLERRQSCIKDWR
jgi:hypothetical protein